jgi:hypothetical protein
MFDDVYLGRILAQKVNLEVKTCLEALQELFSRISRHREYLESTIIGGRRPQSGLDKGQLDLFIKNLSVRCRSLVFILIALNSFVVTILLSFLLADADKGFTDECGTKVNCKPSKSR